MSGAPGGQDAGATWVCPEKLPGSRCGDGKPRRVKSLGMAAVPYEEAATLWWNFPGAAKKRQNKAASGEENWNIRNDIHRHSY